MTQHHLVGEPANRRALERRTKQAGAGGLKGPYHLLAKAMQAHLAGVDLAKISDDLFATDVGELLANKVNDHLVDVSVGEWLRLRARITFYMADDNTALSADPTGNPRMDPK